MDGLPVVLTLKLTVQLALALILTVAATGWGWDCFVTGIGVDVADGANGADPVMALLGRLCGLADAVVARVCFLATAFFVGGCVVVETCGAWGNFRL